MLSEEYIRIVPGAKRAVLMLHGIAGSPAQFRDLVPLEQLVPREMSLMNLRYPGYGGSVMDFGKSTMDAWKAYAEKRFLQLAQAHEQIILVGHSMGTLFSIWLTEKYPEKVAGCLLLQCPLYVGLRWFGVKNLLKLPFGLVPEKDAYGRAMVTACGVDTTWFLPAYIPWLLRIAELLREMAATRKRLEGWPGRAVVFQSRIDELVSNRSAALLKKFPQFAVTELAGSSHFYYPKEDREKMLQAFMAMVNA